MDTFAREDSADGAPVLSTRDLVLSTGSSKPDLTIGEGLTLIHAERESSATVFAMTLAGRMKPKSGAVALSGEERTSAAHLHRSVALAGVVQLDELERLVPLRVVIREQAAWARPWYSFVPYDVDKIESFQWACGLLGLDIDQKKAKEETVGGLNPMDRLLLRVALALVARPEAALLVVDDIDQVRSMQLRAEVLRRLAAVSRELPVIAFTANPDCIPECNQVIHLPGAGNTHHLSATVGEGAASEGSGTEGVKPVTDPTESE